MTITEVANLRLNKVLGYEPTPEQVEVLIIDLCKQLDVQIEQNIISENFVSIRMIDEKDKRDIRGYIRFYGNNFNEARLDLLSTVLPILHVTDKKKPNKK